MDNLDNTRRVDDTNEAQEDQEEIVLRLTARYVAEIQAGRQPDISDYLSRYPQYADAIASFITYYQTVELPLSQFQPATDIPDHMSDSEETDIPDEFASIFRIAEEYALQQVMSPGHGQTIQTLFTVAKQQRLSSSQLASHLCISEDIISLLEQQVIMPETIPQELYRRLATLLQQPVYHRPHSFHLKYRRVAEQPGSYKIGIAGNESEQVSFRNALENSAKVSPEQMQFWHEVFSQEGL